MDVHWRSQTVSHRNVYLLDLWIKDTSLFCITDAWSGVLKFWGPHENGDPGSPFSLWFWGSFHEFGDPQHNSMFTVDNWRISGFNEFLNVNIPHNGRVGQCLARDSMTKAAGSTQSMACDHSFQQSFGKGRQRFARTCTITSCKAAANWY